MKLPDPFAEIRLLSLRTVRGANFWSSSPVTRLDLWPGAYDEISSAEVPGVRERLEGALPGLIEHRCSIGSRGGFLTRLRRGTYVPHIIEHVGLELQSRVGHEVGYGRARGGDRPGEYTVVFEHLHAEVGLRAAALALEMVQQAFAGTLESAETAVAELRLLAESADGPRPDAEVLLGVTGGGARGEVRDELLRRGVGKGETLVDLAPSYLLNAGLPYARSRTAVILDAELTDVPERYREEEQAAKLVTVVADAVPRGGLVVVPARAWEVQDRLRDAGRRVAIFTAKERVDPRDARVAQAVAVVREGRVWLEIGDETQEAEAVHEEASVEAQLAATLAAWALEGERTLEGKEGDEDRGRAGGAGGGEPGGTTPPTR